MKIAKDKQRELAVHSRAAQANPAVDALLGELEGMLQQEFLGATPEYTVAAALAYKQAVALFGRFRRLLAELSKADA
jgi:hypothetical protein